MKFCTTLFVYLALIFQLLLQGGFWPHDPTILVIPLATVQGLKVRKIIGSKSCNVAPKMLNAVVHCKLFARTVQSSLIDCSGCLWGGYTWNHCLHRHTSLRRYCLMSNVCFISIGYTNPIKRAC